MLNHSFRWLLPAAIAVAVSAATAQKTGPLAQPDPLDAKASVPPLSYRSALQDHRRLSDDKAVPWREANETVGHIGGWRAYAREANEAAAPAGNSGVAPPTSGAPVPAPAASAPSRSMPSGHGGHKH